MHLGELLVAAVVVELDLFEVVALFRVFFLLFEEKNRKKKLDLLIGGLFWMFIFWDMCWLKNESCFFFINFLKLKKDFNYF